MKVGTVFKIAGWVLLGVCVAAALAFLLGIVVMALWNWLMPAITKGAVGEMTYWQAVGLFILCHLLFKSHHEHHDDAGEKHRHPRFLARKIHRLLGKEGSESGEAEAAGTE
jgi:hypothetical protein